MQQFAEHDQNAARFSDGLPGYAVRHLEMRVRLHYHRPLRRCAEKRFVALPMATRREPRKEIRVRIRIFGTDYENVFTVNASRAGAMVIEVRTRLKVGEIIGLAYGMA